ncbi:hypothetical protein NPD5_2593 [Clostridium sporogenes]|uniref:Uncharacterized protein n=1 Tax=Clostridium sporogenes TaxID=1509 RepID=A0A1L3NFM9_CLOSG|nr:hypothetical protein [Clostridium sporogenes]APH14919.1 hypothetical protein NPD5_2593 [Clostridium sporogenes]
MKLKLELNYKYHIILSLANKEIKMSKIKENILDAIEKYNSYSLKSVNKKKISHPEIDDNTDLFSLILESEKSLPIPVRGLRYFTQVIMNDVGEELCNEIVRKKSFFRVVDVKEVTNLKLEKSEEIEEVEEIQATNFSLNKISESLQSIIALFLNTTPTEDDREKIDKILEILNK